MRFILFIIFIPSLIMAQGPIKKISSFVENEFSVHKNDKVLVWVFFTDKGNGLNKTVQNQNKIVSEKSLKRRGKLSSSESLLDYTDFPVASEYIKAVEALGVKTKNRSKWLNGISILADEETVKRIEVLPFVASIDLVARLPKSPEIVNEKPEFEKILLQPEGVFNYNYGNSFTQLNQINVPTVHNLGIRGQGVTIAVLDAGFNRLSHEVFSTMNIIAAWDFVNNDANVGDHGDMGTGAHGTQTLSVIGGFKEGKLIGPAFQSNYILAKTENTDSERPIEEDNWIAAMEWADSIGVDVTSSSLGYLDFDAPFPSYTWQSMNGNTCRITIAADLAVKKGIVVLNSAGNEGFNPTRNTLLAPSDGDSVIAVGAVTSSGARSSFSSVGNTIDGRIKPDIMAMGSSVTVASTTSNTNVTTSNGTSFSCPLAAGVAALILSYNPNLTPMQVRFALRNTASNAANPNREMGWGIINALFAVNECSIPVELVSFSATRKTNKIELNWNTSCEVNNKGFEIERSFDIINWTVIAYVHGNGTTVAQSSYSYLDNFVGNEILYYRLKQIDFDGSFKYSTILEIGSLQLFEYKLNQNYPNPFNPSTVISYQLAGAGHVTLKIYDLLGREVTTLVDEEKPAGSYTVNFDAGKLSTGVYFYELKSGTYRGVKKLMLMK